jgi:hypothetical protein
MVLYNIEKGRQRLRTDLVHQSLTRENTKVKGRDHWCKWYGLAHPMNILDLQYLANRRKSEEHLFIFQTVLMDSIVFYRQTEIHFKLLLNNCLKSLTRGLQWICRLFINYYIVFVTMSILKFIYVMV